jgi:hypothetical protein
MSFRELAVRIGRKIGSDLAFAIAVPGDRPA